MDERLQKIYRGISREIDRKVHQGVAGLIMSVWFVSRHQGAIEWMKAQSKWKVNHWIEHLDMSCIKENDIVIGVLPIALASEVCAKGAIFYSLVMPQTYAQRGNEHSLHDMKQAKCYLMRYDIKKIKH